MAAPVAGIEVTWTDEDFYDSGGDDAYSTDGRPVLAEEKRWKQIYSADGACNRKMHQLLNEKDDNDLIEQRGPMGTTPETSMTSSCDDDDSLLCGAALALLQHCDPRAVTNNQNIGPADDSTLVTMATNATDVSILDTVPEAYLHDPMDEWDTFTTDLVGCSSYEWDPTHVTPTIETEYYGQSRSLPTMVESSATARPAPLVAAPVAAPVAVAAAAAAAAAAYQLNATDVMAQALLTDPRANTKHQAKPTQNIEVIYDPELLADIGEGKNRCSLWPRKP